MQFKAMTRGLPRGSGYPMSGIRTWEMTKEIYAKIIVTIYSSFLLHTLKPSLIERKRFPPNQPSRILPSLFTFLNALFGASSCVQLLHLRRLPGKLERYAPPPLPCICIPGIPVCCSIQSVTPLCRFPLLLQRESLGCQPVHHTHICSGPLASIGCPRAAYPLCRSRAV